MNKSFRRVEPAERASPYNPKVSIGSTVRQSSVIFEECSESSDVKKIYHHDINLNIPFRIRVYSIIYSFGDNLSNIKLLKKYSFFEKSSISLPLNALVCLMMTLVAIVRSNIHNFGKAGPIFTAAHVFDVVAIASYVLLFLSHGCLQYLEKQSSLYSSAFYVVHSFFGGHLEDVCIVLTSVTVSLFLLARVVVGACDPLDFSNWIEEQQCNRGSLSNSLPVDQEKLIWLTFLASQILIRGVSGWGVSIALVIILSFTITCTYLVNGSSDAILNLIYSAFAVIISWEFRRTKVSLFLEARASVIKTRELVANEMLYNQRINDMVRQSAEHEKNQLRSLCGNVAHDLKTPLQSISIGIEQIKNSLLASGLKASETAGSRERDAVAVCDLIASTSLFMELAINRAIDFTKISNSVALVPQMSIFDLKSAMMLPIKCMQSMQSDFNFVLWPLPEKLASVNIITDLQWLRENLLCLLSNSVKYSNEGNIQISVIIKEGPVLRSPPGVDAFFQNHAMLNDSIDEEALAATSDLPRPSACSSQEYIIVSVTDCGIGVSAEAKRNLFKPFSQTQRMAGGTGLGLYSLDARMRALGGACGVADRPDKASGAVFWFSVLYKAGNLSSMQLLADSSNTTIISNRAACPRASAEPALAIEDTATPQTPDASSARSFQGTEASATLANAPLHVLLVDDSAAILKVVKFALEKNGHIVYTAKNGFVGLKAMLRLRLGQSIDDNQVQDTVDECVCPNPPKDRLDLVLMDFQMPIMDGFEAVRRYRAAEKVVLGDIELKGDLIAMCLPRLPLPIVGVSASSDESNRATALEIGMDDFIAKPFTISDFNRVRDNLLSSFK